MVGIVWVRMKMRLDKTYGVSDKVALWQENKFYVFGEMF